MKLHSDKQIEITHEVVAHILKLYDIFDFTFTPINIGIENTSVCVESGGKKYVLRVYAYSKRLDDEIYLELELQEYMRTNGIPIPVIYTTKDGAELAILEIELKRWQAILMEFIEGESITPRPSFPLISELAHIQAHMHMLGIEFAEKSIQPKIPLTELNGLMANKIKSSPVPIDEVFAFIERVRLFVYPLNQNLPYGYNHLDLDFDGNIITRENKIVGIIDFDDTSYSPAVLCLGSTLWNILDDSGLDAFRFYLKEYESIRLLSSLEREILPRILLFRNYEIGIIRLLLWEEDTPIDDITKIIKLEKDITSLDSLHFR